MPRSGRASLRAQHERARRTRRPRAATGRARRTTSAMAGSGSMAPVFVVPAAATTRNGRSPEARSHLTASASAAGSMRQRSSTATVRKAALPWPGQAQGLGDAPMRLRRGVRARVGGHGHVAEAGVPRRHHRRELRERSARREQARRAGAVSELVREPAQDVRLEPHQPGRRGHEAGVAVQQVGHEARDGRRRQAAARDVGQIAGPDGVEPALGRPHHERGQPGRRLPRTAAPGSAG